MTKRLIVLSLAFLPFATFAQDAPADKPQDPPAERRSSRGFDPSITDCSKQPNRTQLADCANARGKDYTIQLNSANTQNDANEILVAVRNLADPYIKVILVTSQNIIAIHTYPEEFERIQSIVKAIDLPHATYRVTYTLSESEAGKRVGVQHFSFVVAAGQRLTIKQGSKVPVSTGKYDDGKNNTQTQFTYLDVGASFDTTVTPVGKNFSLKAKVEQSSVAETTTIAGVNEPVIRQSVIDGVSTLPPGKSVNIGAIDVPGSTRHIDIDAMIEPL